MKVLSLFDGMACGMLAMRSAGIDVDRYVAFEIDKYAVQTSAHNFPMIEHRGDVFQADFSEFRGFDFVVGGSPCTYWSIAQKNNRETEASGMGWELFSQYVRAVKEAQPLYFIYENNKSMSNAIRQSITETFGFEPICINSALVSAQNRQRLYWVGKRNLNGTYSRVHVEQPEDRGILLRDVLDGAGPVGDSNDKAFCMTASYQFGCSPHDTLSKSRRSLCAEPVNVCETGKAQCLKSQYGKSAVANFMNGSSHYPASGVAEAVCVQEQVFGRKAQADGTYDRRFEARTDGKSGTLTGTMRQNAVAEPVGTTKDGKSYCLTAGYANGSGEQIGNYAAHTLEKGCKSMAAEPVRLPEYGNADKARPLGANYPKNCGGFEHRMFSENPKKQQVDMIAHPVRVGTMPNNAKNQAHDSQPYRIYSTVGKSVALCGNGGGMGAITGLYAIPTDIAPTVVAKYDDAYKKFGYIPEMYNPYNNSEITEKSPTLTAQCNQQTSSSTVMVICSAIPIEFDEMGKPTKAVSGSDGKTYIVYEVQGGQITIKEKQYPIKLADGFYIIRKLTVSECKRLQTVPEWYYFPVSDAQAYKMLGNGWTVEVIAHLIAATQANTLADEQLCLF